jgi:hypothetical protein
MGNPRISEKKRLLLPMLFLLFFCFGNAFFAEPVENLDLVAKGVFQDEQMPSIQDEPVQGKSISIRLGRTHFDPLRKLPTQKAGIREIESYDEGSMGYYIVQFDGPIKDAWKNALTESGAEVFDYIPDYAFIIRMNSGDEQVVGTLPHVRWLGIFQPTYRISQQALDKMYTKAGEPVEGEVPHEDLRITVFPGEDIGRIKSGITALGGTVTDTSTTSWKTTLKAKIPANRIGDLTLIPGIKWVEPIPTWKPFNDVSTDIMNVRTPRETHGLYGEGQTVGICDTGLDRGLTDPANLHDDFEDGSGNSRVIRIFDRVGDGANDVNSGHGTHVAGSVLGNGKQTPPSEPTPFAGIAPEANLIFQAAEANATGDLSGIPVDLNALFSQADSAGADLHTNSWGSAMNGMYTSYSEDVDEYIWDNPDFLILFAAGNEGIDQDGDGVIDLYSLGGPATAKNCLTVGASEGNRPNGVGYDFAWGNFHPYEYSTDPIFSDHLSDDPAGMAAFSGRGPVIDGRYKPDLVAPGTNILSTRSSVAAEQLWADYDEYYAWSGGTSMATPLAAGAAALVREYLIKEKGYITPSAALIKAALLNSAEDISPGQYGTGSTQEIPNPPVPNNVQGWGRLNLGNGVYTASPFNIIYHDERNGLNTDEYLEYTVPVSDASYPLKINLVWTDYPGSPAVQGGLVNDLDLQVTDPSSTIHYPDNASQKSTVSTLAYNDGEPEYFLLDNRWAIRFTPSVYPVNIESVTFFLFNATGTTSDLDVVVYDDDGAGGLPGAELFRKTLTYAPTGFITTGITGVVVSSGDFYVAVEKNDLDQYLLGDDGNPTGRSYYHDGADWVPGPVTPYIGANVRGADISTSFDRVNNAVGLTLINPDTGTYTIRVSGHNVPQGPQGYALVISGAVTGPPKVTTGPATSVDSISATLNGTVNPNGSSTTYYFEYGLTPSYGSQTPETDVGSGIDNVDVSEAITVLDPIATYHYRLVATNALGTSYGEDMIFTNDKDADAMPDDWEQQIIDDAPDDDITRIEDVLPDDDYDGDELTNLEEYQHSTDPCDPDTDSDDLPDGWEVSHGLDPLDSSGDQGGDGDIDSDGWTNREEYIEGSDPRDDMSPPPTPPQVMESIPHGGAGLRTDTTRVPSDTSFAVRISDSDGIDVTDTDSIKFTVDDDVDDLLNTPYERDLSNSFVRVLRLSTGPDTQVTDLWVVYDRQREFGNYVYERNINILVEAKDRRLDWMPQASFDFNIESAQEHDDAAANLPDTGNVPASDPDLADPADPYDAGVQVNSGVLEGAKILYDSGEPIEPTFGPTDEIPPLNMANTDAVGVPMNLQPPTVYNTPVRIFIPCPGHTDVSHLSVFLYNGTGWVLACNAAGIVQPADQGWMAPGSRINHNNGNPSTIEIQVYHFSGVQPGLSSSSQVAGGGGGGGCLIATLSDGSRMGKEIWFLIALLACGMIGLVGLRKMCHEVRLGKGIVKAERKN